MNDSIHFGFGRFIIGNHLMAWLRSFIKTVAEFNGNERERTADGLGCDLGIARPTANKVWFNQYLMIQFTAIFLGRVSSPPVAKVSWR